MVYFIQCTVTGRVKIGVARKPAMRLRNLQCGSPTPLRILVVYDGDLAEEKLLHERFSESRLHGEWFELSDGIRAFLAERGIDAESHDLDESLRQAIDGYERYRGTVIDGNAEWERLLVVGEDVGKLERQFYKAIDAWAELVNGLHSLMGRWSAVEYRHSRGDERFHVSGGLWDDHESCMAVIRASEPMVEKKRHEAMMQIVFDEGPAPSAAVLTAGREEERG